MFTGIIGHTAQKDYLTKVLAQNSLAHAYCFSGPSGIGKFAMAKEFVGIDAVNVNPNVTVIDGGSVEEIRDLRERLSLSAFGGTRKIAIIDGADQMTLAAQNALLKTLEEPAGLTTIILIAADANRLLPTILSRTVHLKFTLVERELICQMLRRRSVGADPGIGPTKGSEPDLAHELAGFAVGRPGVAMGFSNSEVLEEYRSARAEALKFIEAPLSRRITQIDEIVKSSREDKSRVEEFLNQIMFVLHEKGAETKARALEAVLESRESLIHNGNRSIILEHVAINV